MTISELRNELDVDLKRRQLSDKSRYRRASSPSEGEDGDVISRSRVIPAVSAVTCGDIISP